MFEEDLISTVGSVVGLSGKVFPLNAPKGTQAPYCFFLSSNGLAIRTLDGNGEAKVIDVEINIVHRNYSTLKALSDQVMSQISSCEAGMMGSTKVNEITHEMPVEKYEHEVNLYRCIIDYKFYV